MFDYDIIQKAEKVRGAFWKGGVTLDIIRGFEEKMNIRFPKSYIHFLKEFGAGGFSGTYINGIEKESFASVVEETLETRKEINLPETYLVVREIDNDENHFIDCLDISHFNDNECVVKRYDLLNSQQVVIAENFEKYFNDYANLCYNYMFK